MVRKRLLPFAVCLCLFALPGFAQDGAPAQDDAVEPTASAEAPPEVPESVSVQAVADDFEIEDRLERILRATGWFERPGVRVDEGVVFLTGTADEVEHSKWATRLAGATEDVVAVVNRMQVTEPPMWNIAPAVETLRGLARDTVQAIPMIGIALVVLILTWVATRVTLGVADMTILKRIEQNLLREVARKALAVPVIVVGLYLVLMVSGLSRLAVTVIGGTGLFGLVLGVAFRDIMENFLSSILISIQNPFKYGDLIEVEGHRGYVQRVNTRGTLLMTLDGNHIQIPNSTIYKNVIKNFTSNPNVRYDFIVGIGYDALVTDAQDLAMQVLRSHPAVLQDPEPMVLVEELGSATVNLKVYFWVNGHEHSGVKVKSSIIRQITRKLDAAGVSMPDDAREVIFPSDVPVRMLPQDTETSRVADPEPTEAPEPEEEPISTDAEGDFGTEAKEIHEQGRLARDPEDDRSELLGRPDDTAASNTNNQPTVAAAP